MQEIFTLCGGHISPILVASEKLGIKIIDTRHEVPKNEKDRMGMAFGIGTSVRSKMPIFLNSMIMVKESFVSLVSLGMALLSLLIYDMRIAKR